MHAYCLSELSHDWIMYAHAVLIHATVRKLCGAKGSSKTADHAAAWGGLPQEVHAAIN